ncbi:spindle pole body component [Anaeramoeba flamelloides]|uniref:Spindle pole body component n=1 Tax=Anaeramoeba flamelloides TaxID=1746091 RepID=A0ABQ8YSK1_9EUKA|nr:spindle pole body component [Anaeramoeba flamelloides]
MNMDRNHRNHRNHRNKESQKLEEMKKERKEMKAKRNEMEQRKTKLENERDDMIQVRNKMQAKSEEMQEERKEMQEKRKEMQEKRKEMQEKRKKIQEKLLGLQLELLIFEDDFDELKEHLKNTKEDIEKKKKIGQMIILVKQIEQIDKQNEQIKEQDQRIDQRIDKHNLQIDKQNVQIKEQNQQIKEQNLQIDKQGQRIKEQNVLIKEQNNRIDKQFERDNMSALTKNTKDLSIGKVTKTQQEHKTQGFQPPMFTFVDRENEILTLALKFIHNDRLIKFQSSGPLLKPHLFFISNMFGTGKTWFGMNFLDQLNKIFARKKPFKDLGIEELKKKINGYPENKEQLLSSKLIYLDMQSVFTYDSFYTILVKKIFNEIQFEVELNTVKSLRTYLKNQQYDVFLQEVARSHHFYIFLDEIDQIENWIFQNISEFMDWFKR